MNILIVTPQLPYPLIDASKKSVFYPIRYLSERGHRIHVLCLWDHYDASSVKAVKEFCTLDGVMSPKNLRVGGALKSLFSSIPYEISRFHNTELMMKVRNVLDGGEFDILHVEGIHAAIYGMRARDETGIPTVMRMQNVHWVNLERMIGQFASPFKNAYLRYEAPKVRRYEARQCGKFDRCLTISQKDTNLLLARNPAARCTVVPLGVDLTEFSGGERREDSCSVLWMGALRWIPNQDSFWWFYREIVPRIVQKAPEVVINVIGSNPPESILGLRHPNVRITGFVNDTRAYLLRSQVCVVPLRAGSGVRLKLLEMLAMRKAVVATSVGCEGLGVRSGEHVLVEDDPEAFADAVVRMLRDPKDRDRLGGNGQAFVREHYSWEKVIPQYEQAYTDVIQEHGKRSNGGRDHR